MAQRDREHAALLVRLRAAADYDSYREFYGEDEGRGGDDVYVGEVVGGELRWGIRWLPNGEVAGLRVRGPMN